MRKWLQLSLVLVAVFAALAQTAPPAASLKETFEVASIKPSDPDARGSSSNNDGRFLTIKNWTLKRLVQRAFGVQEYQVAGGPNWTDGYRFDIRAKLDERLPAIRGKEGQLRLQRMLEALLADRFQFQFHRETKVMPVYNMVVSKSGLKISEAKFTGSESTSTNNGHLTAKGLPMPSLATYLSLALQQPVLDATGVSGVFDFEMTWAQQDIGKAPDANDPAGPSIFTALQEQLGLKLELAKGPVEMIVIDHAEKPTEN